MAKRGPKVGSKDNETANEIRRLIKFKSVPSNVPEIAEYLGLTVQAIRYHIRRMYGT